MRAPVSRGRRSARRAIGLAVAVALVAGTVGGCAGDATAPSDGAYGVPIHINTPPGLRAKQTLDMLNSDWPIGPIGVRTLATPAKVDEVSAKLDSIWWDRPFTVTGVNIGARQAKVDVVTSYGVAQQIQLRIDDAGMVERFDVSLQPPKIRGWADIDTELTRSGARYSYRVSRVVGDGRGATCDQIAGTNTELSLPLASIFKLYVLLAVADAVNAGTINWADPLTVTKEAKAVGSSNLEQLPAGAVVSVQSAAQQMISVSDNMATDLLISKLGPGAVERALVAAGHHDPASMTPFPTMHEMFSVGWGEPDLREQWRKASPQDRMQLLEQTNSRPYEPDPTRTHTPASEFGAEWYGSAADICKVHVALQAAAVGKAEPVKQILSAIPGIALNRSKWPYIGAKGGNLPGDLTFSWYVVDRARQPWVVSFQLNWPRFRSPTAAGWLLSIVHQTFDLVPTQ